LSGDKEAEVTSECFAALLRLAPSESLEFVAKFLGNGDDALGESAALALGESRLAAAFPVLRAAWEGIAQAERRKTILLAMAMLRLDEAVDFLVRRVEEDSERAAADAVRALALYSRDEAVRGQVQKVVKERGSKALGDVFEREFRRG
jgi:hypothetical protein